MGRDRNLSAGSGSGAIGEGERVGSIAEGFDRLFQGLARLKLLSFCDFLHSLKRLLTYSVSIGRQRPPRCPDVPLERFGKHCTTKEGIANDFDKHVR